MADNADQGNNGAGQEPGAGGTQQTGQEPGAAAGQQGQEPGAQGGTTAIPTDPTELAAYAARLQKDATEARAEAAKYRTAATAAQAKITEAERAAMTDAERAQADQAAKDATLAEKEQELAKALERITDLTEGAALRDALATAGAHNPQAALNLLSREGLEKDDSGNITPESKAKAITALRQSDPYLFKRGADANAGAGAQGGTPGAGAGVTDWIRRQR